MAFLLDTVTLSEVTKRRANAAVIAWIVATAPDQMYLSALTIGEIRRGIVIRRRRDPVAAERLDRWLAAQQALFADRVLAVDATVADCWGNKHASGTTSPRDGLIAATAIVHGLTVATRNVRDFSRTGVKLVNPWEDKP